MDCDNARRLLEAYFVHRKPKTLKAARVHLDTCGACTATYERMFAAEAALSDPAALLSVTDKEDLLLRILPPAQRRAPARRFIPALTALGLVGSAAALVLLLPPTDHDVDGFRARGGNVAAVDAELGLRLFCLTGTAADGSLAARPVAADAGRCGPNQRLGFAYRNQTTRPWYLQIAVVPGSGAATTIFPPAGAPGLIEPAADEVPMEIDLPLAALGSGKLLISGVFSQGPLAPGALLTLLADRPQPAPAGAHLVELVVEVGETGPTPGEGP